MRRSLIIILIIFFALINGVSQNTDFKKYVNSFKGGKTTGLLDFRRIVEQGVQMSKDEALRYVYNGDTAKLYCVQKTIDMETEKITNIKQVLFLPNKCIKKDFGDFFLIIYSSFECVNDMTSLFVMVIDKQYMMLDKLHVYKGNDYGPVFHGLINLDNGSIFLIGNINDVSQKQAVVYKLNYSKMKYEIVKEDTEIYGNLDYPLQMLKELGMFELFMK